MYFDKASLCNIYQPIYILPAHEQLTLAPRWPVRVVRVYIQVYIYIYIYIYIYYTCYKVRIISIGTKQNGVPQ